MALRIPTTARDAAVNAVAILADAGAGAATVQIRSGTQPVSANDPATGTLLATLTLSDPAFTAAVGGTCVLDVTPIPSALGVANGTAGWFRILDSNGATVVDGRVALSGAEMNLSTLSVAVGVAVDITGGTLTMPGE